MIYLLVSIFSLLGIGVLANVFFPYEIITEAVYDNALNYLLSQVVMSFSALLLLAWVFFFGFLIGKAIGEDSLEESA